MVAGTQGSIEEGLEELDLEDHRHILVLSEKLLECSSIPELSSTAVHGVGSLIESVSVAWTELAVSSFQRAEQSVTAVDSDVAMDLDVVIPVFDKFATEHPVINALLETRSTRPIAISDILSEAEFKALDLYRQFYAELNIVDQLSVGRVFGDRVIGCSINRSSRGFSKRDRAMLNALGHVIFSTHRMIRAVGDNKGAEEPLLTVVGDPAFLNRGTSLGLSDREAEVLAHIASGKSNKQIALACDVSVGTVRKHTENIYRRLEVNNRVSATLVALEHLR